MLTWVPDPFYRWSHGIAFALQTIGCKGASRWYCELTVNNMNILWRLPCTPESPRSCGAVERREEGTRALTGKVGTRDEPEKES